MSVLGKLAYQLYFKPRAKVRKFLSQGARSSYLIRKGQKEMEQAALQLHYKIPEGQPVYDIHFLTGQKYWYQTAFCAYSLTKAAPDVAFRLHIFDDGSFDPLLTAQVKKQFPEAIIHQKAEIEARLAQHLPAEEYPFLHFKRGIYPHIKKLTDVYAGVSDYRLVLDSDMLFFNRPDQMIEWMQNPDRPIYILDAQNSYHYSFELMEALVGKPIREKINVGLVAVEGASIDWAKLEHWAKTMEEKEGSSYYLEQALTAMLIAQDPAIEGKPEDYIVMPSKAQVLNRAGALQHYVADSKEWYLREGWKLV